MRRSLKEVLLLLFFNQKRRREINKALSVIFISQESANFEKFSSVKEGTVAWALVLASLTVRSWVNRFISLDF